MSLEYFTEIEALFARRRGTPFVVSAKDWALMKKWNEEGIPLPIVLEAIDTVFDRFDAKERTVNGLSFVRHAVRELWKERRELQVGAHESTPEEDPTPRLVELADALVDSWPGFASRVRALRGSVPKIEEQLIAIEEELLTAILDAAPDADAIREEARALTGGAGGRSEAAALRRIVREKYDVPRLSLFS